MSIAEAEMRAVKSEGKYILSGYAAIFNTWGSEVYGFREKIAPGAFGSSIGADDIRSLFNHDANWILGRNKANTLTMREDTKGLWMEVMVNPDDPNAMSIFSKVQRGDVSGQSFSFKTKNDSWVYPEAADALPERTLLEVKLFDVGPVTYPFYEMTDVGAAMRSMELNRPKKDLTGAISSGEEKSPSNIVTPSGDVGFVQAAVMRKHQLRLLEMER
jgi:hypothetical protein